MSSIVPGVAWFVGGAVALCFVLFPTWRAWGGLFGRRQAQGTKNAEVLLGADGRYSTSKLAAYVWTAALTSGAATLLAGTFASDAMTLESIGMTSIPEVYMVLIAVPYGGLVGAKLIVTAKVENHTLQKPDQDRASAGPAGFIEDDCRRTSLVDIQYLAFNALLLLYFVAALADQGAIPELPEWLVGLSGAGGALFLAQKAIERNPPEITAVSAVGRTIDVRGKNLLLPEGAKEPNVAVSGHHVAKVTQLASDKDWRLTVETLEDVTAPYELVITTAAGATTTRRSD